MSVQETILIMVLVSKKTIYFGPLWKIESSIVSGIRRAAADWQLTKQDCVTGSLEALSAVLTNMTPTFIFANVSAWFLIPLKRHERECSYGVSKWEALQNHGAYAHEDNALPTPNTCQLEVRWTLTEFYPNWVFLEWSKDRRDLQLVFIMSKLPALHFLMRKWINSTRGKPILENMFSVVLLGGIG